MVDFQVSVALSNEVNGGLKAAVGARRAMEAIKARNGISSFCVQGPHNNTEEVLKEIRMGLCEFSHFRVIFV